MQIPYFRMTTEQLSQTLEGDDGSDPDGKSQSKAPIAIWRAAGLLDRDLNFYLQTMQTNIALAGEFPVNFLAISNFQQQTANSVSPFFLLSVRFIYGFERFFYRQTAATAKIRAAQLALQVERFRARHGQYPKNLNSLIPEFISAIPADPFDGQPMRYHTLTNGYVIYSVDRDLHDNNGHERPLDNKSIDAAEYDITFTVHR